MKITHRDGPATETQNRKRLPLVYKFKLAVLAACLSGSTISYAQTLVTSHAGYTLFSDTIGYKFTVGTQALLISQVGVADYLSDGLSAANRVGIWTSSGSIILDVSIPAGTGPTLSDGYRWITLGTPIQLAANTNYVTGSQANSEYRENGFLTLSSDVTLIGVVRNNLMDTFSFPNSSPLSGQAVVGPNFVYSAVPEPAVSAFILGGFSLFVLMAHRRCARKAA